MAKGEVFKTASPTDRGQVFRVRGITKKATGVIRIDYQEGRDARVYSNLSNEDRKGLSGAPSALQKLGARKLTLDPGGIARDSRA